MMPVETIKVIKITLKIIWSKKRKNIEIPPNLCKAHLNQTQVALIEAQIHHQTALFLRLLTMQVA
jgi:hypothetical protein